MPDLSWPVPDPAAAEAIASLVYENQKMERLPGARISTLFASYEANWPCLWGEEVTGLLSTWTQHWNKYQDGWKYTCGLRQIRSPCIVYSLGSSGNMAFEAGVLAAQPNCTIRIFDKSAYKLEKWFPDPELRSRVHFTRAFISGHEDLKAKLPRQTLSSIMRANGDQHIDVLKIDIEGSEYELLAGPLRNVGQLLLEAHLGNFSKTNRRGPRDYKQLITHLEQQGLRIFHKEPNARYAPETCIELAFIQASWRPDRKQYGMDRNESSLRRTTLTTVAKTRDG